MDMFPDTAMVREIQQELDKVIQQGVRNITLLIRASDPAVANTLQTRGGRRALDGSLGGHQMAGSKGHRGQRKGGDSMENSLSDRLVKDGLLTPDLLRQLQQEWSKEQSPTKQSPLDAGPPRNNKKGKQRKKK